MRGRHRDGGDEIAPSSLTRAASPTFQRFAGKTVTTPAPARHTTPFTLSREAGEGERSQARGGGQRAPANRGDASSNPIS